MLLNPAKEELYLSAQLVNAGVDWRRQEEMVGEKDKAAPGLLIKVAHLAQRPGKSSVRPGVRGPADLIAAHANLPRVDQSIGR